MTSRRLARAGLLAALALLTACSTAAPEPSSTASNSTGSSSTASSPTPSPTAPSPTPDDTPDATASPTASAPDLTGWSIEELAGQVLMVGVDVRDPAQISYDAVREHHVGNIFLAGRSRGTTAQVAELVTTFTALVSPETTRGTPMLVATDQEGGQVQVLQGHGFSRMPSALEQSASGPDALRADAQQWGSELAAAGITLNLAPVFDVVPDETSASANAPIGAFQRNYGYGLEQTVTGAQAFAAGMSAAGVDSAMKHFPGLGRVTANTDTSAHVVDQVTTRDDDSVRAFAAGIDAGAPFVMISSAVYTQLDPDAPAAFSVPIVTDLLRGDLGFEGVVISDDLSAAAAVQQWSPGERAVRFVAAGGDLVLASADPSVVPDMAAALADRARTDADFATRLLDAATRVVAAKPQG
ncbi:MAG: glycoside hydrolase family 3 N-terminal domain-containing protein [Cellulomonadaceae bacterium]